MGVFGVMLGLTVMQKMGVWKLSRAASVFERILFYSPRNVK